MWLPLLGKILTLCLLAGAAEYPIPDPYYATITGALLKGDPHDETVVYRDGALKLLPARDEVAYYGSTQNRLKFRYWAASGPGPVIVMVAGLGGSAASSHFNFLAYHFVKRGFHVVSFPNPTHFSFALAASRSGYPGVSREDAEDLYQVIQKALKKLRDKAGLQDTSVSLLGMSLGALHAAYLSELDAREKRLNFRSVLLLNPPVDPLFGLSAIEQLAADGKNISNKRRGELTQEMAHLGYSTLIQGDVRSSTYFANPEKRLPTTKEERRFLIGSSMRSSLSALIFTTQQIEDLGVLHEPVATADPKPRLAEAENFLLQDYINKFLLAHRSRKAGRPVTYAELEKDISLKGVEEHLRRSSRVFIHHNADDFIVNGEQLRYLESVVGSRLRLFPKGGHLGNLWFPENLKAILEAFDGAR